MKTEEKKPNHNLRQFKSMRELKLAARVSGKKLAKALATK